MVGQKRPLMPTHVWSIWVRLEIANKLRDLALFIMAVDSKLRGCDLVAMRVRDVFAAGRDKERASIVQRKTDRPVRFEITETTRRSLDRWIAEPEMRGRVGPPRARSALLARQISCSRNLEAGCPSSSPPLLINRSAKSFGTFESDVPCDET